MIVIILLIKLFCRWKSVVCMYLAILCWCHQSGSNENLSFLIILIGFFLTEFHCGMRNNNFLKIVYYSRILLEHMKHLNALNKFIVTNIWVVNAPSYECESENEFLRNSKLVCVFLIKCKKCFEVPKIRSVSLESMEINMLIYCRSTVQKYILLDLKTRRVSSVFSQVSPNTLLTYFNILSLLPRKKKILSWLWPIRSSVRSSKIFYTDCDKYFVHSLK